MPGFGGGFLTGFTDFAKQKVDQNHAEQEQRNTELRNGLWKIAYDPNQPETVRQNAQEQLQKLYPNQKQGLAKFSDIFHNIAQRVTGAQQDQSQATAQPGGGGSTAQLATPQTPVPQSGAPASPSAAPIPVPVGTAPSSSPLQLSAPKTPVPQLNGIHAPSAGAPPAAASPLQLTSPKTPLPTTQAFQLPPSPTDADLAASRAQLAKEAQAAEAFKTNESIRARKSELQDAADQEKSNRAARIAEIEADTMLSPEDKRRGRLEAYGIPYQPGVLTAVHYQDNAGNWHPAQHNSKDGSLVGMDNKPIDLSTVKDVRPEPPTPIKPSGELSDRMQAQEVIANPDKHTPAEMQAAKDYLKHVDAVSKGTTVRIENAQNQASSQMTDDELHALAQREKNTGQRPAFGMGQSADRNRYNRILAQEWSSDPNAASALAAYKAGSANLRQLSVLQGQIGSFEDAFKSDLQNARDASAIVPRTSARRFNNFTQLIKSDWTDDPALAQLKVAAQTAVNQYARLVSSASGGGVSTDTARAEATALLDKAMAKGSFNAALDQMEIEAGNRVKGIQNQIDKQTKSLTPSPRGQQSLQAPGSKPKIKILSVQ